MKALVTGAPGWLGTTLVQRLLAEGISDVTCLAGPSATDGLPEKVRVVRGDVTRPESLPAFFADARDAVVFHAAGVIHPRRRVRELFDVNVGGTRNLLEAAARAGIRRFVHVSSNSPLGLNRRPDEVFDEQAPYRPYLGYGKSKMLAEQAVQQATAFETVIVRPPWFYGPNQPARQTLFFTMIREGKVPLVGAGDNRRSMAFVDNICDGLLLAARVPRAAGQIYWIADRRPYAMNEILSTVEDVMESDFGVVPARKRLRLPSIASPVAYAVDATLQGLGMYHQKIHVLSEMGRTIACSVAKAEAELGYDPKVDLREGMRRSLAWLRDRGISW